MKEIFSERNFRMYLVYCLTFVLLGGTITGLGPILPYLAEA